jgi:hypothetical protein
MPGVRVSDLPCVGGAALALVALVAVGACGGHLGGGEGFAATGGAVAGNGGGAGGTRVAHSQGGTLGSGGVGGIGGAGGSTDAPAFGEPACPPTVRQRGECTPADPQFCYAPCGPEAAGVTSETCRSSGVYDEMMGCSYDPARDYSCYRIPPTPNTGCAPGPGPQAGKPCDLPRCMPCNSRDGLPGGEFFSAAGAGTVGWCVCAAPDENGRRTWSCANTAAWPCPLGAGC